MPAARALKPGICIECKIWWGEGGGQDINLGVHYPQNIFKSLSGRLINWSWKVLIFDPFPSKKVIDKNRSG